MPLLSQNCWEAVPRERSQGFFQWQIYSIFILINGTLLIDFFVYSSPLFCKEERKSKLRFLYDKHEGIPYRALITVGSTERLLDFLLNYSSISTDYPKTLFPLKPGWTITNAISGGSSAESGMYSQMRVQATEMKNNKPNGKIRT